MINPIQQNVVFNGSKKSKVDFTKNSPAAKDVRSDYNNAVSQVLNVQHQIAEAINANSGNNLNTIA